MHVILLKVMGNAPFRTVYMEGFLYLFSKILINFTMPSRYIITKCCNDIYFEPVIIFKKIINDADIVSITTDG